VVLGPLLSPLRPSEGGGGGGGGGGSTQRVIEMNTKDISWSQDVQCLQLVLSNSYADYLEILGASASWSPQGLFMLVKGLFSFLAYAVQKRKIYKLITRI